MINVKNVGDGQVFLIAGGGRTYSDIAARFCRTEKDVEDLIASPQSKQLIRDLINSGHKAALEFDEFIFGVQGYARVTEVQLVRKRHASYMIKSGRVDEHGKRSMDIVIPDTITKFSTQKVLNPEKISLKFTGATGLAEVKLNDTFDLMKRQFGQMTNPVVIYNYDYMDILELIDAWYDAGIIMNIPEEDLRYMKPQATEFKAAIKMNATALRDWAQIRMCFRAQREIRDLCCKMVELATNVAPDLMKGIGPSCKVLGYCPELEQCNELNGKIPTKAQALEYLRLHKEEVLNMSKEEK